MIFTNNFNEPVIVFLFGRADRIFPLVVADPIANMNLALAAYEEIVDPGRRTRTLSLHGRDCYVGIKRGGGPLTAGRFGPYLVPPTLAIYQDNAELVLTARPELQQTNAPVLPNPNPPVNLATPLPPAPGYVIGVGRASVEDPAARDPLSRLPMQGWAEASQVTIGVEEPVLTARAFIIGDPAQQTRVVFVVADIWSCTIAIKQEVIRRLRRGNDAVPYRDDNIWIAGTHTHSGPGGFSHHFLYNATGLGFDAHVFDCIVAGIVRAIENAHLDIGPGKVFVDRDFVTGIAGNRSVDAFNRNPPTDRNFFPNQTDEEMLLLKFVRSGVKAGAPDIPVGALTWYGLHPTCRGKINRMVNGDHKGWAAMLFEQQAGSIPNAREPFVAAFANACGGDASGNGVPGRFDPPLTTAPRYETRMRRAGDEQCRVALQMFNRQSTELSGPINIRHQFIDLPARTGVSGALGISMAAGSVEDGGHLLIPEGLALDPRNPGQTTNGLAVSILMTAISPLINQLMNSLSLLLSGAPLASVLNSLRMVPPVQQTAGHFPKPIMLMTGSMAPVPFTPNILPIQLFQIGRFALLGMPAEVTTVAGLRLKRVIFTELARLEVSFVAIGTYANGYSQYVTTPEEYNMQHYEGASTLFGANTLPAYERAFQGLATALLARRAVPHDAPLVDLRNAVFTRRRMTFRNMSRAAVRFRIFSVNDSIYLFPLFPEGDFVVQAGEERAVIMPLLLSHLPNVQVVVGNAALSWRRPPARRLYPGTSDLVVALPHRTETTCPYFATSRTI